MKSVAIVSLAVFVALAVGVSVAFASLTFNGTSISGDSNSTLDATGTVTIGASSATGITVGRSGITATFPGTVTITGTTTTLQNLVISGTCSGCSAGSSGITAINNLSNSTTSIIGAGTVMVSTSSPNVITITGTGSGAITINSLTTSTFSLVGTANQITVVTSSPNILTLSLPQNIATGSSPSFTDLTLSGITGSTQCLHVDTNGVISGTGSDCGSGSGGLTLLNNLTGAIIATGTTNQITVSSSTGQLVFSLPQSIAAASVPTFAGLTINGNATTTGNLAVLGSLLDASGNKYVTSTAATGNGTVTTSSAISANNFPFWATTTGGLSGTSTLTLSGTTITQANAFNVDGVTSLASTTITGQATTTNLSITSLAGASGCLSVTGSGLVATSTCSGAGGAGTVTTSSAVTTNDFPFWGASIGLAGTSTLSVSGTTITQANNFLIGGSLNVTSTLTVAGTTTLNAGLIQSGGVVSLASTTINGNATTTGNLAVLGSLLDASGNKYVTSTAGTSPTINGITSSTFNFLAAGTGLSVASSTNPNDITYTWTNPGFITAASSVTWSAAQTFNASTMFSATSTFASTTIFSELASSGSPCLTVSNTGAVATTTCSSGGSSGASGTITAATSTYVAFYSASSTLTGTSTFTFTSSTGVLATPGASVNNNLTIPTNQALTTAGQLTVETTTSTLAFDDGTAQRVLDPVQCISPFIIQNVTSTPSDEVIWSPYATSTIILFRSVNLNTGDTVTFNVIWGANRSTASASAQHLFAGNVTSTSITAWDNYPSLVSFASTTVPANSFVRVLTTSAASSSEWTTQLCYRENP